MLRAIGIILILTGLYFSYDYGYNKANTRFEAYKREQSELIIKKQEEYQSSLLKARKEKDNEIANLNNKHSIILKRLQQRPERSSVPEATVTAPVCTGAGSTGEQLFREDAEFLIGEAAKAEVLKQSLIECRALLE